MTIVPVILAGGIGVRFWPLSRSTMPKQLLRLVGKKTMAEETLARIYEFSTKGVKPIILTGTAIASKLQSALPKKWRYDLVVEPVGKNTAPAVALAAAMVQAKYGDAVMVVLSADHDVRPKEQFCAAVRYAADLAQRQECLVVFGIKPDRPETGYGYLELGSLEGRGGGIAAYKVKRFVEKPDQANARRFMKSGKHMWNSGMFVWRSSVILDEYRRYMPELYRQVTELSKRGFTRAGIDRFYRAAVKESVDYGIMEHSSRVSAVVGPFQWDDIGSWESVRRVHGVNDSGTAVAGRLVYERDCSDSIIVNESPLAVAAIGLSNAVVVATGDAILVVDRSKLPELKKYVEQMKSDGRLPRTLF